MNLSRKQTTYALILGLGLGALLIDRLVLGGGQTGPEDAAASVQAPSQSSAGAARPDPTSDRPVTAGLSAGRPAFTLAHDLKQIAQRQAIDPTDVRDAFRPAESWLPPPPTSSNTPGGTDKPDDLHVQAQAFKNAHQLFGVVASGPGGSAAIVNNRTVKPGQSISGFKLVELGPRSATFAKESVRVTLTIQVEGEAGDQP